jgi:hypothetical protein
MFGKNLQKRWDPDLRAKGQDPGWNDAWAGFMIDSLRCIATTWHSSRSCRTLGMQTSLKFPERFAPRNGIMTREV